MLIFDAAKSQELAVIIPQKDTSKTVESDTVLSPLHFLSFNGNWPFDKLGYPHVSWKCGSGQHDLQSESRSIMSNSLQCHGLWPIRLLCLWNSSVKNAGVGCHCLLFKSGVKFTFDIICSSIVNNSGLIKTIYLLALLH